MRSTEKRVRQLNTYAAVNGCAVAVHVSIRFAQLCVRSSRLQTHSDTPPSYTSQLYKPCELALPPPHNL